MNEVIEECTLIGIVGPMGTGKTEFAKKLRDKNGAKPFFLTNSA